MFQTTPIVSSTGFYRDLDLQLKSLLEGERNWVANAANFSSLLFQTLPDLNWAGFYVLRHQGERSDLLLGPFQGKPACVRIPVTPLARGVCGAAANERRTLVVDDVHAFPGHIACDSASRSEIVVPLLHKGVLWGVLDLDSPKLARFNEQDATGLELLASTFVTLTDLT